MKFYIYYQQRSTGRWYYERTCGTVAAAKERVEYLLSCDYSSDACWRTTLMEGAFV